jgi:hypothetical protein
MAEAESNTVSADAECVSFDEFRLYYESTERVTDRRLEANRWNYSISLAVLVGIAALGNWAFSGTVFLAAGLAGTALLGGLAVLFTSLWIKQITDFKALNAAKFAVLNKMAHKVHVFDGSSPAPLRSYCPFEREWEELQASNALAHVRATRVVGLALNSSNSEYYLPKAIRFVFAAISLASLVVAISNWDSVERSLDCLVSDVESPQCR